LDFSRNLDLELVVIQQHDAKVFGCSLQQTKRSKESSGFITGISDRGYSLVGGVFHHVGFAVMK